MDDPKKIEADDAEIIEASDLLDTFDESFPLLSTGMNLDKDWQETQKQVNDMDKKFKTEPAPANPETPMVRRSAVLQGRIPDQLMRADGRVDRERAMALLEQILGRSSRTPVNTTEVAMIRMEKALKESDKILAHWKK